MESYIPFLEKIFIFDQLDAQGITYVLSCLEAHVSHFEKNEIIYHHGEPIPYAGLVISGDIVTGHIHEGGNEHDILHFVEGDLFGESYACDITRLSTVDVLARKKSSVLFMKFSNLFQDYATNCPYASRITANLLLSTTRSNLLLNKKVQLLSLKQIRERIFAYFEMCDEMEGKIHLPFNRQDFANYLGVDRSALSRELARMKEDGLIAIDKNTIEIL